MHQSTRNRGFSVLKFTVVTGIVGVLTGLSLSNAGPSSGNARTDAGTQALLMALQTAQVSAVTLEKSVTVCALDQNEPDRCDTTEDSAEAWGQGILVFTDGAEPGVIDGADKIVMRVDADQLNALVEGEVGTLRFNAAGQVEQPVELTIRPVRNGRVGAEIAMRVPRYGGVVITKS